MWRLAGLLLFLAIWGISGKPVPSGKATFPYSAVPQGILKYQGMVRTLEALALRPSPIFELQGAKGRQGQQELAGKAQLYQVGLLG